MNPAIALCSSLLALALSPGPNGGPRYGARRIWTLDAEPIGLAALMAPGGREILCIPTRAGLLRVLARETALRAPATALDLGQPLCALASLRGYLVLAAYQPPRLFLVRPTERGPWRIAQRLDLPWPARALASAPAPAPARLCLVGESSAALVLELRSGRLEFLENLHLRGRFPHSIAALTVGGELRWAVAYAASRELELVGSARHLLHLEVLPRRVIALPGGREVLLCCGAPSGGDALVRLAPGPSGWEERGRLAAAGPVCFDARPGDLDGDGLADLSVLNLGHSQLSLRRGLPGGTLGPAHTVHAGQHPERLELFDLDADGDLDWVIAHPRPRMVSVLFNRAARPQLPRALPTPPTPTALVARAASDELVVICEGSPGIQLRRGAATSFTPTPGRSLLAPLLDPGQARLWSYDLLRRELVAFALEPAPRLVQCHALPLDQPLGPVAAGDAIALAEAGQRILHLCARTDLGDEPIELPFPLAGLYTGAPGAPPWAVGRNGEVALLSSASPQLIAGLRLPPHDALLPLAGTPLRCVLAQANRLLLFEARTGVRPLALLTSTPARLRAAEVRGATWIYAACPASHTLEIVPLDSTPQRPPLRYGAGLAPRDLVLLPRAEGFPAVLVASSFSNAVLRFEPRRSQQR